MKTTKLAVAALAAMITATAVQASSEATPSDEHPAAAPTTYVPYFGGVGDPLGLTRPIRRKGAVDTLKTGSTPEKVPRYRMPYVDGLGDPDDLTRPIYD